MSLKGVLVYGSLTRDILCTFSHHPLPLVAVIETLRSIQHTRCDAAAAGAASPTSSPAFSLKISMTCVRGRLCRRRRVLHRQKNGDRCSLFLATLFHIRCCPMRPRITCPPPFSLVILYLSHNRRIYEETNALGIHV